MARSSVLIIYTGGTIGMKTDPATGVLVPFDFSDIYDEFPALRKLDVDVVTQSFDPIDSSNVSPELWMRIARAVEENYDRFDGFVVLHGTDTMSYSSSALSFMFEGLGKPVIFTGSQIPLGVARTDGRENFLTAIEIAAAKENGAALVPEVCLYFQNSLMRANRTKKSSAEELEAFVSSNYPALADVGVGIHYRRSEILRPGAGQKFSVNTSLSRDVLVVKIFPGLTEEALRAMLSVAGIRGVVLETYGAGNAPSKRWFLDAVEQAVGRGIHIINVTQCLNGAVDMQLYETGRTLREAGVIGGGDITTEAALGKLMHLLGQDMSHGAVREKLGLPLRGEMTIIEN